MLRAAIVTTYLLTGASLLTAQSTAEEMPANHMIALKQMATVVALERFCPTFQANNYLLGAMLVGSGLKNKHTGPDGEYFNEITIMKNESAFEFSQETESQVCWIANYLYGPKGTLLPNLMIPR